MINQTQQALQNFATDNEFLTQGELKFQLTLEVKEDDQTIRNIEFPLVSAYLLSWQLCTNDFVMDAFDPDPSTPDFDEEDEDEDFDDIEDDYNPPVCELSVPVNRDIIRELRTLSEFNYGEATLVIAYVQRETGQALLRHILRGYIKSPQMYGGHQKSRDPLIYDLRLFCTELELNLL